MTRTNKMLLSVAAVGAAALAFWFLVLSPKREEVTKLDTEIAAKTAEIEQARVTLAGYEQAKASYKRNYTTLARLGKAVPADDDVRSLLVQIEATADRSGVDFEKIELGAGLGGDAGAEEQTEGEPQAGGELAAAPGAVPVAGGVLSAMPFSFSFSGSYFDLSAFLARLERFVTVQNDRLDATGRLLRLESVALQPASSGFPTMTAEINAATYLVPPVEAVPGAAAPATPPAGGAAPADSTTTTASATTGAAQ
jgi:Tfp pilus assembly protein PilO